MAPKAPPRLATTPESAEPRWPAFALAALAAACMLVSVSFQIYDTDLWQHLVRGKAMLELREIPRQQIWTWANYGSPEKNATWAHAILLWPFWSLGGVTGLFVWRWLTVLATFGLVWAIARRLGARGLTVFVVMVACAMVYRARSQMRPETLAIVLLALELWILETRRAGGPDRRGGWFRSRGCGPACTSRISWGLGVLGLFAVDELWRPKAARPRRRAATRGSAGGGSNPDVPAARGRRFPLWWILIAAVLVSFLNPLGWQALAFPFEYYFKLRGEGLDKMITELGPIDWPVNWRNGLPLLLALWPAVMIARWRRGGFDRVELVLWIVFTAQALFAGRFVVFWVVVGAPYMARGLAEMMPRREGAARLPAAARAGLIAAGCLLLTGLEVSRADLPLGLRFRPGAYPVAACDFMAAEGVKGRGSNYFEHGGYMLWRFWPERERLPFMTTVPELATPEMRFDFRSAMMFWNDWQRSSARYRFDYALLKRVGPEGDRYLDFLDADSTFALVFMDDAAALYVRRGGMLEDVARRHAFRWASGGEAKRIELGPRLMADSSARAEMCRELERAVASSPRHAFAASVLASVRMLSRDWGAAERALEDMHQVDPSLEGYWYRKGVVALQTGRPAEAVRAFEAERGVAETPGVDLQLALAHRRTGNTARGIDVLEQASRRFPAEAALRDTLAAWTREAR